MPFVWACGSPDQPSTWDAGGAGSSSGSSAGEGGSGASTGSAGSSSGMSSGSSTGSSSGSGGGSGNSSGSSSGTGGGSGSAGNDGGGSSSGADGGLGSSGADGGGGSADGGDSGGGGTGVPTVQQFDTACLSVPDPDIAASGSLVGMVGQWTAYFYKKDGTSDHQYKWTAATGWRLISDTHIVYDKPSGRWFITTIVAGGPGYGVQVMVSSDATASSWQTSVPATDTQLIDNPQPTVTSDKVLLVFHGGSAWVVDKTALYSGNATVVQPTATNLPAADNWVAVKYGGNPPSTAYAVTLINQTTLAWISVDGTQAANNVALKLNRITVPSVNSYPFGPSLYSAKVNGSTYESGEVKAMFQGGHIYWAKTVNCGALLCERLFDIDTTTNTAKTTDFNLANNQMWFGVPGVDKYQNVWMLATTSTVQGPMGLALMGLYSTGTVYNPNIILNGQAQVGSGMVRMGDYSSAAQDPTDGSVWLIGMYGATNPNPLNPENNLGCRAVHVTAN